MSGLSKKAVKNLVVSYAAFSGTRDDENQGFWAGMLIQDQRQTGVVMHEYDLLESFVERGKEARKRRIASETGETAVQLALQV